MAVAVATQPNQFVCGRFSDELNPKLAVKWMFIAPQGEGIGLHGGAVPLRLACEGGRGA